MGTGASCTPCVMRNMKIEQVHVFGEVAIITYRHNAPVHICCKALV